MDELGEGRRFHQHRRRVGLVMAQRQGHVRGTRGRTGPGTRRVNEPVRGVWHPVLGRSSATFARNSDGDPDQPTRSAALAAGIVGVAASNALTCAANTSKLDPVGSR